MLLVVPRLPRHKLSKLSVTGPKMDELELTVMTVCSLIVNGPVLRVQRNPNVLNTWEGITWAQKQPTGYTSLKESLAKFPPFYREVSIQQDHDGWE